MDRRRLSGIVALALALPAAGVARADVPPGPDVVVARPPLLQGGEGRLTLGTGSWLRAGTGLTVGNLDLRWGLDDRFELRILLPGIAILPVRESTWVPALVLYAGFCELGFNTSVGSVLAYQLGVEVTKRLHDYVRVRVFGELRHRGLGREEIQLGIPGPLPSSKAWLTYGDLIFQIMPELALSAGGGYSVAIGDGPSFAWASFGITATFRRRTDLFLQGLLAAASGGGVLDPAVFGGVSFAF